MIGHNFLCRRYEGTPAYPRSHCIVTQSTSANYRQLTWAPDTALLLVETRSRDLNTRLLLVTSPWSLPVLQASPAIGAEAAIPLVRAPGLEPPALVTFLFNLRLSIYSLLSRYKSPSCGRVSDIIFLFFFDLFYWHGVTARVFIKNREKGNLDRAPSTSSFSLAIKLFLSGIVIVLGTQRASRWRLPWPE